MKTSAIPIPDPWSPIIDRIADAVVERLKREKEAVPRLLTPEEAARHLNRSKRWLRARTQSGELKPVETAGARPRYDREALDRWIEERS